MANAIYLRAGTTKTFKETGGDVTWTPKNVANANGRISAVLDLGAFPGPRKFRWRFTSKFQTGTVGASVRLYIVENDDNSTATQDGGGGLGTADATLTSETILLNACKQIGPTVLVSAAGANIWSGRFITYARYIQVAAWNASGAAFTNTAGDHEFAVMPMYEEIQ